MFGNLIGRRVQVASSFVPTFSGTASLCEPLCVMQCLLVAHTEDPGESLLVLLLHSEPLFEGWTQRR